MQTNSKDYITIAVLIFETKISTREKKTAKTLFHYTNERNLFCFCCCLFLPQNIYCYKMFTLRGSTKNRTYKAYL